MFNVPQFPHFTRKINASLVFRIFDYIFWYGVVLIIAFNLLHRYFFPFDNISKLKRNVTLFPGNPHFHEELAKYYLGTNYNEAAKEYALSQELYQNIFVNSNIYGTQAPENVWALVESSKWNLSKQYDYWKTIEKNYPEYSYAAVKVAVLEYQLGKKNDALSDLIRIYNSMPYDYGLKKMVENLQLNH